MIKQNGKEVPIALYKFYMHDYMNELIEYLKPILECKTNTELFTKIICHVYGEVKQMQDWHENKQIQTEVRSDE